MFSSSLLFQWLSQTSDGGRLTELLFSANAALKIKLWKARLAWFATWEPVCRAWGVARDIGTKTWHGTANAATADSFYLIAFLSESSVKVQLLSHRKDGGFHSKLPVHVKSCHSFWTDYPHTAAVFLQKSCSDPQKHPSPRRTPLISQQRAGTSLLTFFLCHLGAPCVTDTTKIIEAAKIRLPIGVWGSKGALLDPVGTGCGMLLAGRMAWQLWVEQSQL